RRRHFDKTLAKAGDPANIVVRRQTVRSSDIAQEITFYENEANHRNLYVFVFNRFIFGATVHAFSNNGGASQSVLCNERTRAAKAGFVFALAAGFESLEKSARRGLQG